MEEKFSTSRRTKSEKNEGLTEEYKEHRWGIEFWHRVVGHRGFAEDVLVFLEGALGTKRKKSRKLK